MSKVVHIDGDVHSRAKTYCANKGLKMSQWVGDLINSAIAGAPKQKVSTPLHVVETVRIDPVPVARSKPVKNLGEKSDGGDLASKPPFWEPESEPQEPESSTEPESELELQTIPINKLELYRRKGT